MDGAAMRRMQRRSVIVSVGAILGTSVGAAAYSSATVERDATIEVSADQDAFIGLVAGDSEFINNEGDQIEIDISDGDGNGINTEATFSFGDADNPDTDPAFEIRNNGVTDRTIDVEYDSETAGGAVEFHIYEYDTEWTSETTVTADDAEPAELEAGVYDGESDNEFYVIIDIDTAGIGDGTDLGGTLRFTVDETAA